MSARFAGWVLAMAIAACVASARADSAASASTAARQRVEVTLVGELSRDSEFASRVTSWFDPVRFEVEVKSARGLDARRVLTPEQRGVVFVWVTLREGRGARLFFASSGFLGEQKTSYLLRELRLPHGLDELGAERVAQVLNLSALALLEGQAEIDRDEMERSLSGEVAETSEPAVASGAPTAALPARLAPRSEPLPRRARFSFAAGYGLSARGDEGIFHGPRVSASLGMERAVTGLLSLATALPERERLASLDLRFWSMSALLALALDQQASKALRVLEFVGPRLEWTRYAPSSAHELGVEPGQATGEFRPGLTLGAALEFGRAPGIALVVEGTWLLRRTAYELKTTSGRERIGNSPRLVPTVALEVGFF